MRQLIEALPKVELHLHIEGTLEPELCFELAERNRIRLPFESPDALRRAYQFEDLSSFLALYYQAAQTLVTERDFYDLTAAYLERCRAENVQHVEIFFDPQTHTQRGVRFEQALAGIAAALDDARHEAGITSCLIPCFLRDQGESAALATYQVARDHGDRFVAFGLDSAERGYPPSGFVEVFQRVRADGFRVVAHAGEEGPAEYIREAIDLLGAERIDHGVRSIDDPALLERLARERIPLTVCPLSNVRLGVYDRIEDHCLPRLLEQGLVVTINSDDPAYFGGYLTANWVAVAEAFDLDEPTLRTFATNAVEASFASAERKRELIVEIDAT